MSGLGSFFRILTSVAISAVCISGAFAEAPRVFEDAVQHAGDKARASFSELSSSKKIPTDTRCAPEDPAGEKLYSSDFHWSYGLKEMQARFEEIYASDKRLPKRAFWNTASATYELPYMESRGGKAELPASFVRAVVNHIETAFADEVVDAVFFPDMGHSHFLIPKELYDSKYSKYPVKDMGKMYADLFADPRIEVLYHTAEQLTMREEDGTLVDDDRVQLRYRTRNIIGKNAAEGALRTAQNPESRANTVSDVPGFYWWGAGFNLSANKNGCFSYNAKGKTYRFDISLYDLEPDPSTVSSGDY